MPLTQPEIEKKAETMFKQALDANQSSIAHWSGYTWPEGLSVLDKVKIKAIAERLLRTHARIAAYRHNGQAGGTRKHRRKRKSHRKSRR
jgi:hypothetical protein